MLGNVGELGQEKVILPPVIFYMLYDLQWSLVIAILVHNGIQLPAIIHNADNQYLTHTKLMVVFLPYHFRSVYKLSALRLIVRGCCT